MIISRHLETFLHQFLLRMKHTRSKQLVGLRMTRSELT